MEWTSLRDSIWEDEVQHLKENRKNQKIPMQKQQIGIQQESVGGGASCPFEKSKNLEAFPRRKDIC